MYLPSWNFRNQIQHDISGMVFDFWPCGPAANPYTKDPETGKRVVLFRGAYPAGFLDHLKAALGADYPEPILIEVAHVCAGSVPKTEGITIDTSPQFNPDILANAENFSSDFLVKYDCVKRYP